MLDEALVAERGLRARGFQKVLRSLAVEFARPGEDIDGLMEYWYGFPTVGLRPCAFQVRRGKRILRGLKLYGVTVEIYESSVAISNWKLTQYGWLATSDGPEFELHIVAPREPEVVISNEDFCVGAEYEPDAVNRNRKTRATIELRRVINERRAEALSRLRTKRTTAKWKAAYDAVRELGIKI